MDQRYMVKQWVAEVRGAFGWFRVFRTGSDQHYLFCQLDPAGNDTGLHVPVAKRDLQPDVRRALANGHGHARVRRALRPRRDRPPAAIRVPLR